MLFWYEAGREPSMKSNTDDEEMAKKRRWREIPGHHQRDLEPVPIFLDHHVLDYVEDRSIPWCVSQIADAHDGRVSRVEVVPYQWTWDQNFFSVVTRFFTSGGVFAMVWTLKHQCIPRNVLSAFEGRVTDH